jgi:hypothetical protein
MLAVFSRLIWPIIAVDIVTLTGLITGGWTGVLLLTVALAFAGGYLIAKGIQ